MPWRNKHLSSGVGVYPRLSIAIRIRLPDRMSKCIALDKWGKGTDRSDMTESLKMKEPPCCTRPLPTSHRDNVRISSLASFDHERGYRIQREEPSSRGRCLGS